MSSMNFPAFEGFDAEPNEVDDEIFLSEAPLSLMKENIRSQFEDPTENHKNDFVQTFLNKYIYTKKNELEEEDMTTEELHDEFIGFMRDTFKEFLGIGIPQLEDKPNDQQEEIIHVIYRYFIIGIKKNFVRVILNYIEQNKDSLYNVIPLKKEIAYNSYKNIIQDEKDLCIITNISTTVDYILHNNLTIDNFFDYSNSDSKNYEGSYLDTAFDDCVVTGNFVEKYIDMIDDELLIEIECKVKNKLLKPYTKNIK